MSLYLLLNLLAITYYGLFISSPGSVSGFWFLVSGSVGVRVSGFLFLVSCSVGVKSALFVASM